MKRKRYRVTYIDNGNVRRIVIYKKSLLQIILDKLDKSLFFQYKRIQKWMR